MRVLLPSPPRAAEGRGKTGLTLACRPLFRGFGPALLALSGLTLLVGIDLLLEGCGHGATSLFDGRTRTGGRTGNLDVDLGADLTLAEQAHTVAALMGQARFAQDLFRHLRRDVEPLLVDRLLQAADVHFRKVVGEDVAEAALRHTHVQRHLAAFEAIDLRTGTGLRALHAASRRLAETGRRAAADLELALVRARIVADFVELHG